MFNKNEWRTMESAPKDFSNFLAWDSELKEATSCSLGWFDPNEINSIVWQNPYTGVKVKAIYWKPMPEAPDD